MLSKLLLANECDCTLNDCIYIPPPLALDLEASKYCTLRRYSDQPLNQYQPGRVVLRRHISQPGLRKFVIDSHAVDAVLAIRISRGKNYQDVLFKRHLQVYTLPNKQTFLATVKLLMHTFPHSLH